MQFTYVSHAVNFRTISEEQLKGVFEISGLYSGYGVTIGNALRRVLLSSLPGAAVTQIKIKGVPHEFTTIPGIKEDVVELMLNFKKLRIVQHVNEPQTLFLKANGERVVTANDIEPNSNVQIVNKNLVLATLTSKNAELDAEITTERGLGYSAVEARKREKVDVGVISVDALFSPVRKVNYTVENMRVGDRTDYNRLIIEIETDGTISPSSALHKASIILKDHFEKISAIPVNEFELSSAAAELETRKKRAKSKEDETS